MDIKKLNEEISKTLNESAEMNEAISNTDYLWIVNNMKAELAKYGYTVVKDYTNKKAFGDIAFEKGYVYVSLTFDPYINKIDSYYETPMTGEKTLATISINKSKESIFSMIKKAIDKKLAQFNKELTESTNNKNESLNEDEAYEESLMDAFETVRGAIETAMHNIKLESKPVNFNRIANAMTQLKLAADAFELANDPEYKARPRNEILKSCYNFVQEAKKHLA